MNNNSRSLQDLVIMMEIIHWMKEIQKAILLKVNLLV